MSATTKQPISAVGWDVINDLSALPENEDIIIDFLLERLQRGQIYTWVGPLLLTLNPNNETSTSYFYNSSNFDKYVKVSDGFYETSPHIFTVAYKAHYNLTKQLGRNCQVIVISGQTGTGKTYNASKCLEFLSSINKSSVRSSQGDCTYNIMLRVTDACRLITAFTTACTEKNEVSSRHGQLVKLHYVGDIISGATINSFLLERSRVTRGSNNFQIFYQMIFGMSHTELEGFNLSKDEYYDILNVVDYNKRKYFQEGFQDTLKALDILEIKADQKTHIFQILALLIHMGNIKFVKNGEACAIDLNNNKSKKALKSTCILSCLTEDVIVELLTTILINPRSTWRKCTPYHRYLLTVDACRNRLHSIIRHIYDLLFHCILNYAKNTLSPKQEYTQWLGILDIFGFEAFKKNEIEQLCVNYANERLQYYFIETYVESSRNDLMEEGFIEIYSPLHTTSLYKERLHVIEKNLFLTLNDACQSPVAINMSTIIQSACSNLHNTQRKVLREKDGNFIVEHYSGPVAYSIEDILSKNVDKIPDEIFLIFNTSTNKFLRSLINIEEKQHSHTVKTFTKKSTMLAKFKYSMDTVIEELSKCDLHYVQCVKPKRSINCEWDRKDFQKQLACTGIFDLLPLVKCKYSIRLSYKDFYRRYSKTNAETINPDKCKLIVESIVPKKELHSLVHFGKQLIFLTESIFIKLESYRRNYLINYANKIQTFWIRHKCKKTVPTISKYLTIKFEVQNECKTDENVMSVKNILDCNLNKSSTSEEDDDVFITSSVPLDNNNEINGSNPIIEENVKDIDTNENLNECYSENKINSSKKQLEVLKNIHDLRNGQERFENLKNQLKSNVTELKSSSDYFSRPNIHISCNNNNNNNNLLKQHYIGLRKNNDKNCSMHFDKKRVYTIQTESGLLFYKNGILSRRRLTVLLIRMHTRPTCLIKSHVLPHTELPQGLQDCL
ncbi:unnamed protein product [Xylocopa violacea]|uniref:Myosin motor domain-containing protein n=1 Tax=Xylocopa violacea TaxID=135666 RepID=A0ABP1NK82_XYLVO